ncbi:hypothetical protein L218DRAFT_984162 [Marasmius fiardii PR-910]|nr:hypothetical protein L218DRAFT_984162 [Marasmius fiardii PR-910]
MQKSGILQSPVHSLNHLGTPIFLRTIVSYIQSALPSLPLDPVIFQSIFLCLVAGDKQLILRTSEDDISLVMKIAVKILSLVFGLAAHRIRIRSKEPTPTASTSPNSFLRSLFLPIFHSNSNIGSNGSIYNSQDDSSTVTGHKPRKRRQRRVSSRSRSRPTTSQSKSSQFARSISYPNETALPKPSSTGIGSDLGEFNSSQGRAIPSNPFASDSVKSSSSLTSPTFPHSHSDPTPIRLRDVPNRQVPKALVVSGLENASYLSQRALTTVLTEKRIVFDGTLSDEGNGTGPWHSRSFREAKDIQEHDIDGVWPLPDDFFLIYVCPLDEWERPDIHRSLLDRFAMSATVTLQPSVRSAASTLFRPLSFRGSPVLSPVPLGSGHAPTSPPLFSQSFPARQWSPSLHAQAVANSSSLISMHFVYTLREVYSKVYFPPSLNLYLLDLFSAARYHPQLEGRLLTAVSTEDTYDLCRAWRVLAGDPTGMELIEEAVVAEDEVSNHLELGDDPGNEFIKNALEDIGSENVNSTGGVLAHRLELQMGIGGDEREHAQKSSFNLPILEVTQSDVAKIAPRVISHRVRMRNGPQDEVLASAMFGAALSSDLFDDGSGAKRRTRGNRITIKDILVSILQEV